MRSGRSRWRDELGDKELLGDALNTRGVVRSALGEAGWVEDFERSLALGLEINSWRVTRAYLNLGSTLISNAADLRRAEGLYREGLRLVERHGSPLSERWFRGNLVECTFHLGHWDEALRLADDEIGNPEPHYMKHQCRFTRGYIRLARGDGRGAVADGDAAVEDARAIRDPQTLIPSLTAQAFLLASTSDGAGAARILTELARSPPHARVRASTGSWVVDLAFALLELDREAELIAEEDELSAQTPWRDAAMAIARGDLVGAADILQASGAAALEAHARLRAAGRLTAEGRHAEAEEQLQRALAFYRSVGATRYVREGEALLAAAS